MTSLSPLERQARRQQKRRDEIVRWAVRVLAVLVVLAIGIALGEALHDNPTSGGSITLERTVRLPSVPPGSTIVP